MSPPSTPRSPCKAPAPSAAPPTPAMRSGSDTIARRRQRPSASAAALALLSLACSSHCAQGLRQAAFAAPLSLATRGGLTLTPPRPGGWRPRTAPTPQHALLQRRGGGCGVSITSLAAAGGDKHDPLTVNGSINTERTPWGFILLCAAAITISYADRSNLATSILKMAEELHWSLPEQGIVLSSFFAGYAVTGLLGGYLADRFGGSLVLQAGILLWSVFTFLTPAAASMGLVPAIAARVLLGAGEGVAFPAIHAMIPQFVPPSRRSLAVAVITGASYVGAVVAFALTPLIIQTSGWPAVFYLFGGLPVVWFPLWWWLNRQEAPPPAGAAAAATTTITTAAAPKRAGGGLTWAEARRILSCKEIWAILVAQFTSAVGLYGLLNWLPTYYNKTFGIDIGSIAAFTMAPYVLQALVGVLSGYLADVWIAAGWRVKSVRRLLQTAGTLLPALFLVLATGGGHPSLHSSFLYVTAGASLSALTLAAVSVSHLDVCPKHAGFVFAAGNTLATIGGLISVPLSGLILERTQSFTSVFALFAASYVVGAIAYWLWVGDADILECELEAED